MKEYVEILELDYLDNINKYLEAGWDIIETLKTKYYEEDRLRYVVGYPATKKIEDLKEIIKNYEKANLKEELFKSIADSNDDDFNEIEGTQNGEGNATTDYMNFYERTMGSKKKYSIKKEPLNDFNF
ncbi:hypothetical protein [Bacillus safensis]|uniref:hypothetical protein n=1 Tax=Bacillus safensis TaxID=561879 RepID=UPI003F7C8E38